MKIAVTSNFDLETWTESFTKDSGTQEELQALCDRMNNDYSSAYYVVVPDNYKLKIWEP